MHTAVGRDAPYERHRRSNASTKNHSGSALPGGPGAERERQRATSLRDRLLGKPLVPLGASCTGCTRCQAWEGNYIRSLARPHRRQIAWCATTESPIPAIMGVLIGPEWMEQTLM